MLVQASCHGTDNSAMLDAIASSNGAWRVEAAHGPGQKPFRLLLDLMRNDLAWLKVSGPEQVSSSGPPFHDAIPFARAL
jgi:hypothetical protein